MPLSEEYYVTKITPKILEDAIAWMRGKSAKETPNHQQERNGSITSEIVLFNLIHEYMGLLDDVPVASDNDEELKEFIDEHEWGGVTDLWDHSVAGDKHFHRRFIQENLAKATKVMVHWVDGLHRISAYDGATTGTPPPQADEALRNVTNAYSINSAIQN